MELSVKYIEYIAIERQHVCNSKGSTGELKWCTKDSWFDDFQRKETVFSNLYRGFQVEQLANDKYHYATILRKGRPWQTCMYDEKSHCQLWKEGFTMCTTRGYVPIVQCRRKSSQKNTKRELLTLSTICIVLLAANGIPFFRKGEINRRPEIFWKQA